MSFLNPVNEPVKRFKSTDAGAPQINYNARVAGDVKAVLKSCLVTGYGTKASAGWSIVNEVNHVAEFVSPSVAMSDYRLGINDSSASSTEWGYWYESAKLTPKQPSISKAFTYIGVDNGWELLVTSRGIVLIEIVYNTRASNRIARLTYWGQVKTTAKTDVGINIAFWCSGHGRDSPNKFFDASINPYDYRIEGTTSAFIMGANVGILSTSVIDTTSAVDMAAELYIRSGGALVGQQPAVMAKYTPNPLDNLGVIDVVVHERPMIQAYVSQSDSDPIWIKNTGRLFLIYLDYWEY